MAEKEYIAKEFVIDAIEELKTKPMPKALLFDHLTKLIEIFPTENFAPVKHGHWIPQFVSKRGLSDHFMCSECAESTFTPRKFEMIKYAYCPNCGAKMDGGEGE